MYRKDYEDCKGHQYDKDSAHDMDQEDHRDGIHMGRSNG